MNRYWLTTAFALLSLYVVYPIILGRAELSRIARPRKGYLLAPRERGRHEAQVPVTIRQITVGRSELIWTRPGKHTVSALRERGRQESRDAV